ncbi:PAS domain-containing hybrid sensor histidine kinase/response regulator [Nocardioides sp.]|uniref:PAS domain-containing hybrid sensor histidine kinase/response regulator n=1 Tax=Nocardioides sp. TaxID=35761 RepID=UPI00272353CB|nr:PAS domain-containing hybrid sensor histidine kinase/response regulator [Nocardioides sp.]MDO9455373.1 response regulator [Nocardioides sp.]
MKHGDLYRQIVHSSTDGIVALELDGTVRFANESAETLLGTHGLEGRHFGEFLDEAGRRHSAEHLARAGLGTFLDDEVDTMVVRADGSPLWVRLRQTGLREGGRYTGVILRLTDNHETKQLLEAVYESRRQLMRAERIARSGSWTWDVAAQTATHSEGLEELYGEHVVDLLATDRERLMAMTHPEDQLRLNEAVDQLISGERPRVDLELRHRGRHGWMWVRLRALGTYDAGGTLTEVSGTYQDITRARDTEDELQDLVTQNSLMHAVATAANEATTLDDVLRQAASMVVLHDDWDRARAFVPSPSGTGLVPYVGPDALAGDTLSTTNEVPAEVEALELATAEECLRLGHSVWDTERRLTIAAPIRLGEQVLAVVTITSLPPLFRHDLIQQMVDQAMLLIARVAEREASAHELAVARDRAVEASQHKSDFLATMSHEIRTPLNGIIGLNELLSVTTLSDRQRHFVSGIAVSSRTLLDLLNNILDFSKIEAGRLEVETLDFEVREVLAEVGEMLADSARERDVELRVSCSADVPDALAGDPTRLKQVLLNLGSNALKFTTAGSVSIRATADRSPGAAGPPGGCLLRLEVRDTGMGITSAQQEHIFAPFSQADASTTRRFGGTGLGLAISAEIVAAHGGDIGVVSEPGAGSTFWFTVPLGPASGSTTDDVLAGARQALGGTRILVVDDDAQDRTILVEQLGWWGVDAIEAEDSVRAVAEVERAADATPYAAVLVSASLPELAGLPLATGVRQQGYPAGLPLIVLTSSYVTPDDELRSAGIATCLVRPVSSAVLRDALLAALAGPGDSTDRPSGSPLRSTVDPGDARGRVLVVEDNAINQLVARGFLEAMGFAVVTADDGQAALDLVGHQPFDAVLMDVQMPVLDGYATTRALREREAASGAARLPVLAMTAAAIAGERERCLEAGMDDFLTKPVSPAALHLALDRWVTMPSADLAPGPRGPLGPDNPHLDLDRLADLLELGEAADAYLERAIGNFVRRRADVISTCTQAVQVGDAPALSAAAHALRGSASNLGLPDVTAIATQLEALGREGTVEGAMYLVVDLAAALADAGEALEDYLAWRTGSSLSR